MCGLVGVAGKIGFKQERVAKTLLELDTIRGPHSTGVLVVDSNQTPQVYKQIGTPWDLYSTANFKGALSKSYNIFMGHNRAATKGAVNRVNAHPFEFDSVIGCHNGTLTKQCLLDHAQFFDVDSENIYHHMDVNGVSDTIKNLCGAFALTWFDKTDDTFNVIRNSQRPLYYTYSKDKHTLFWASEKWMITVATGKHDVEVEDPKPFEVGHHYMFEIPYETVGKSTEMKKPRVKRMEMYVDPFPRQQGGYYGGGNYQKGGSKVSYLPNKKKSDPYQNCRKYMGKEICFIPEVDKDMKYGPSYIECSLLEDADREVRIYCKHEKKLWETLKDSCASLEKVYGKVKAVSGDANPYLVIDVRSVKLGGEHNKKKSDEEAPFEQDAGELLPIAGGVLVDLETWKKKTEHGCAICASPALSFDANKLTWLEGGEYVCEECIDLPYVQSEVLNQVH